MIYSNMMLKQYIIIKEEFFSLDKLFIGDTSDGERNENCKF